MKIADILVPDMVLPNLAVADKESALALIAEHMATTAGEVTLSAAAIQQALIARERLGSTGVGEGVAIPHAKIAGLQRLMAAFARVPEGVPFQALDHEPVRLVFVLLVPDNSAGMHLKALARVARLLKSSAFRDRLLGLSSSAEVYDAFVDEDAKY